MAAEVSRIIVSCLPKSKHGLRFIFLNPEKALFVSRYSFYHSCFCKCIYQGPSVIKLPVGLPVRLNPPIPVFAAIYK